MTDALVAVVVIVHNDPNRLPQAVASALAQSLRAVEVVIVDDASTDNTPEVAAQLARDHDRVSFVRLDTNSGAPGTPRNAGIAASSAPFLFFLDSDDTIDHHACRNLYEAAVRTGSDIVSGRIVRVHLDQGGRVTPWYEWLYRSTVTYQDVDEQPDLLYDTISTNKLYRREFLDREGLRFPDGRQYEDLLFTAKAYCLARGITLIPPVVYFWNVAEKATSLSITNRRDDITGLENRLSIHHDIDAFFAEHGREELRNHKDVKFLKQDLRLYLNDLPLRTPEFHERFMTLMGAYLEHIGPEAYDKADRLLAVAAHLIRRRDARRLVALSAYLTQGRKLDVDLVREGGRIFWGLPQDAEDREWLDVTSLGWQDLPLAKLPLTSTISELSCDPRRLNISAETRNHFGRIPRDAVFTVRVRQRGGTAGGEVPATDVEFTDGMVRWRAAVPVGQLVTPRTPLDRVWDVNLRIQVGRDEAYLPLSLPPDAAPAVVPLARRQPAALFDAVETYRTRNGNLALQATAMRRSTRAADELVRTVAAGSAASVLRDRLRAFRKELTTSLASQDTKASVFRTVLTHLPRRRRTVVFESHMGRSYSDSPKYVYEELRRRLDGRPDAERWELVWSYARDRSGFPRSASLVKRGSWAWWMALARAEVWVDNQGFPRDVVKPGRVRYLQTWHGSALKRMGEDSPGLLRQSDVARAAHRAMVARWDDFLVRSEHDVRTLVRGLHVTGQLLRTGYPRNDPLVGADTEAKVAARRALGLPEDRRIVLYAPTFRESYRGGHEEFELPIDLQAFAEKLPGTLLLVRSHYLDRSRLPESARHVARDVSQLPDITPLMLAADLLVTDYSSVMFDFALTGRPMIFYTYDYDSYVSSERGAYFDLSQEAPGPLVETSDELVERLSDVDSWQPQFAARYDRFLASYCEYDRGDAARQVVDDLFPELVELPQ